jgi:predicted phosphodiesterase
MKITPKHLEYARTEPQREAVRAMLEHDGNATHAAHALGINRSSLNDRLRAVLRRATTIRGNEIETAPPRRVPGIPDLVTAVKTRPLAPTALAVKLRVDMPGLERLLGEAQLSGTPVAVVNGLVAYRPPAASEDTVHPILPLAAEGEVITVGVISDTHYGSKFCMRPQIRDAVQWMVDQGITTILHPGDWTQGIYTKHSVHEVTATSQRDQLLEMAEHLPQHPGLHYHGIAGNHDETWVERTGLPFAHALAGVWREVGRDDVTIHGSMGAFVSVGGVVVHLWHGGSVAYAASYHLQGKAESYSGIKPSILLAGHVHRFCHVEQRGIECILCPCFQGGAGPFGKKMKGSPAIGGLALSWRMSAGGSFRDFEIRRRRYYERERVHVAENPVHGDLVPETVARVGIAGYEEP